MITELVKPTLFIYQIILQHLSFVNMDFANFSKSLEIFFDLFKIAVFSLDSTI